MNSANISNRGRIRLDMWIYIYGYGSLCIDNADKKWNKLILGWSMMVRGRYIVLFTPPQIPAVTCNLIIIEQSGDVRAT